MDISSILNTNLIELRSKFVAAGFDIRFVGGCVRDILHGDVPKDTDLCTDATPDEQIEIYNKHGIKFIATGLQHGTVTVVMDDVPYEITSLRTDVETDGRHATVAYTRNWIDDLSRRDFTINAMSADFDGNLIDPFDGQTDLAAGIVRFVGDAEDRITEDYLRILRWYRFRARFEKYNGVELDIHSDIQNEISLHTAGLARISRERIWMEFKKILSGPETRAMLAYMSDSGVIYACDISGVIYVDDDIFDKIKELTSNPVTILYAAIGDAAPDVLRTWKASSEEIGLATWLKDSTFTQVTPYRAMAVDQVKREWAVELAACNMVDEFEMAVIKEWEVPVFPVNGNDLIGLGYKPGIQFKVVLTRLKNEWADGRYAATKEDLLSLVAKPL